MKYWRKAHKWLGFVVAIQILLWISGGVVMSVLPIEKVRGKHLVIPKGEIIQHNKTELSEALSLKQWQSESWYQRSDKWIIKATSFDDKTKWLAPSTGMALENVSKTEIGNIDASRHAMPIR